MGHLLWTSGLQHHTSPPDRDRQAAGQADKKQAGKQAGRQTGRQTGRQIDIGDRQEDRQAGRKTDRQTNRLTETACIKTDLFADLNKHAASVKGESSIF